MSFSESVIAGLFVAGLVFSVLISLYFIIKIFSAVIQRIEKTIHKPMQ